MIKKIFILFASYLLTVSLNAQNIQLNLNEALKIIKEQSCGDCTLNTSKLIEALNFLDNYKNGVTNGEIVASTHLQGYYDFAVIHYQYDAINRDKRLEYARKLANGYFQRYPKNFDIANLYELLADENDISTKLVANARMAKLRPTDINARFGLGLYQFIANQHGYVRNWQLAFELNPSYEIFNDQLNIITDQLNQKKCNSNFIDQFKIIQKETLELSYEKNKKQIQNELSKLISKTADSCRQ